MAKWIETRIGADFMALAGQLNIDPVAARVLINRGLKNAEDMGLFLESGEEVYHDPYLFEAMEKATELILDTIDRREKIRIIGDYDVDGITSTYILLKGLETLGADVDYAIPDRIQDGYGLNKSLISKAIEDGISLIITCDNGIAAGSEIKYAMENGIRCIVTDHHEVPFTVDDNDNKNYVIPDADCVIDPKIPDCAYPLTGICGAMVSYKLIIALSRKRAIAAEVLGELEEMAGLGTVCDIMELKDENRAVVKNALNRMDSSNNKGLKALISVNGLKSPISAYHLGFVIGPCLNATGRLDSAHLSVELLRSRSYEDAVVKATELKRLNDMRKTMTEQGIDSALKVIDTEGLKEDKVLIVYVPDIHESLAGIIAGRIKEKYYRPTIVLTDSEEGLKGSGRSIEGYNMFEELNKFRNLFTKFGGHAMAAGLSLVKNNLSVLRDKLNAGCLLQSEDFEEKIRFDAEIPLSYVTERLVENLSLMEPFGMGNPKPLFACRSVELLDVRIMGKEGNMCKLTGRPSGDNRNHELLLFKGMDRLKRELANVFGESQSEAFFAGEKHVPMHIHVLYEPGINEFRGRRSLQFVIRDFKVDANV